MDRFALFAVADELLAADRHLCLSLCSTSPAARHHAAGALAFAICDRLEPPPKVDRDQLALPL